MDNTILNSNVGEPNLNSKNETAPEGSVKLNGIQENKGEVVQQCDTGKKQLDEVLNLNDDGVRVLTNNKISTGMDFTEKDVDNMEAEDCEVIVVDNDQRPKFSAGINKQSLEELFVRKSLRKWKKHLRGSNEAAIPQPSENSQISNKRSSVHYGSVDGEDQTLVKKRAVEVCVASAQCSIVEVGL